MKSSRLITTSTSVDETKYFTAWQCLLETCNQTACEVGEQRIMVSSIAYIVYDVMTSRIKEYKKSGISADTVDSSLEQPAQLFESNVSLYRYGGFALYSLLQKHKQDAQSQPKVHVLEKMRIKHEEVEMLPSGVKLLNQGGLTVVGPKMLPYLRALIDKVSKLVNDEQCCEHGKNMIDVARLAIEDDHNIKKTFINCLTNIGINPETSLVLEVFQEMSKKLFHARVNEYMCASVEIDLERKGKAVKADQSLRDQLNTFSCMKKR